MDFEFQVGELWINGKSFDVVASVIGFRPSRPAPACSNPSDPRFSDSGDGAEYDRVDMHIQIQHDAACGGRHVVFIDDFDLPRDFIDRIEDGIMDKIIEAGEEKYAENQACEEDE